MYQNSKLLISPEMFSETKARFLAAIAWASTETGFPIPREFSELLSGYLTTSHFAFVEAEAKLHHTLKEMTGALTVRQNEIVHHVISGMTNKAIAETIHVSEATVHHEVTKILRTFAVINRGELIKYFENLNTIEIENEDVG